MPRADSGTIEEREPEMTVSRPSRRFLVAMIIVSAGIVWCVWRWRSERQFQRAMAAVQDEIQAGRYATAGRSLKSLLEANPRSDEAAYLLGLCDKAMGRDDAARHAWAAIPPDSRFASRAMQGWMELEVERGRLAEAERIIEVAAADRRMDGSGLRLYLGQILAQEGRVEQAKRIVEARWEHLDSLGEGASEPAINLIRLYIDLRSTPLPIESIREFLDQMGRMAPDDDRVWLGKANLAIRLGDHDEAERWLADCVQRRPDDAAVWSARLELAMSVDGVQSAIQALGRLPVEEFEPSRVYKLSAWIAAQRGELDAERRALEKLVATDPTNVTALDRLAAIEAGNGRPDLSERLRKEKAEIDQLRTRYQILFRRNQPLRDSAEMARLASRLGYNFEARAFLAVALDVEDQDEELRSDLARLEKSVGANRGNLRRWLRCWLPSLGRPNRRVLSNSITLQSDDRSTFDRVCFPFP